MTVGRNPVRISIAILQAVHQCDRSAVDSYHKGPESFRYNMVYTNVTTVSSPEPDGKQFDLVVVPALLCESIFRQLHGSLRSCHLGLEQTEFYSSHYYYMKDEIWWWLSVY